VDEAERADVGGGELAVDLAERDRDPLVELEAEPEPVGDRDAGRVEAAADHLARGGALLAVPGDRELRLEAEEIAEREIARIDGVVGRVTGRPADSEQAQQRAACEVRAHPAPGAVRHQYPRSGGAKRGLSRNPHRGISRCARIAGMTDEGRKLLELALQLGPRERAEIAARLVDSVNTLAATEAAWTSEVELRARRALEHELGRVHYVGASPVPLRFDLEAELDLERAVSWYSVQAVSPDGLLAELTDAIERIRDAPGSFGLHPALPEELGVRRCFLRDQPQTVLFVPMSRELRILAVAHKYRPPGGGDISIGALVTVEDWLASSGLRAPAFGDVTTSASPAP